MRVQRITCSGFTRFLLAFLIVAQITACGGGGGGGGGGDTTSIDGLDVIASAVILAWDAPVARADGSPLLPGEIGGYRVYYGTEEGNYPNRIDVNDGTAVQTTLTSLPPGTYYFVVTTYDIDGRESEFSTVVSKTI